MRTEKELFALINESHKEDGVTFVCGVSIQRMISETEAEVVRSAFSMNAAIQIHVTDMWTVVDIIFEDYLDYDYLQILDVCNDYIQLQKDTSQESMALVLTVTPLGDYDFFLSGVDGFWSYYTEEPTELVHGLRFIFQHDQMAGYELNSETVELMLKQVTRELT